MGTKVPSITLDSIRNLIEMLSLVKIKINIQILHWFLHFILCKGFFAYVFFYFQRQNILWIMNKKCSVSKWSIKHSIDPQVSVLPMITLIHCLSNNRLGLACRRGLPAIRHHNNRVITLEVLMILKETVSLTTCKCMHTAQLFAKNTFTYSELGMRQYCVATPSKHRDLTIFRIFV